MWGFVLYAVLDPDSSTVFGEWKTGVTDMFTWLYIISQECFACFCLKKIMKYDEIFGIGPWFVKKMQDALETPFSRWIWNPIQQFHVISNLPCWHVWLQNVWGIKSLYNVVAICSCSVAKFVLFRSRGLLVGVSLPLGLLLWRHEAWKGLSHEPPVIMDYTLYFPKRRS